VSGAVFAFEVGVKGAPWPPEIVNAATRGRAKAEYFSGLRDPWPDIPWTALRARKVSGPLTSAAFLRVAKMRNLPGLRCGDRVRAKDGTWEGIVVGHNDSANFEVLIDGQGPFPGNVHPGEFDVLPHEGGEEVR
jgi:hypothetical protein